MFEVPPRFLEELCILGLCVGMYRGMMGCFGRMKFKKMLKNVFFRVVRNEYNYT